MAHEIGTASDLEDLFSKIVGFVTTNGQLVAANQQWEVLRMRRDNLVACTTDLPQPTNAAHCNVLHTCRYDPRSRNVDSESATQNACFYASGFQAGTSHAAWQLRTAREVRTVRLRAPMDTRLSNMLRNFRLQYSDDGNTWTTALTVTSNPIYTTGEVKDFAVPASGNHVYWRLIIDSSSHSWSVAWAYLLLLEADGTVANHFGSEVIFKSRNLSGTGAIYTGLRSEYDTTNDWFNVFVNGYTGFNVHEQSWFKQPGALTHAVPMVPCWNSVMSYWLVANGRSLRFVVKVSTNYEGGYLGFFLPYATPNQYPYPLAVGGSLAADGTRGSSWRYSHATHRHSVYGAPSDTLFIRDLNGSWLNYDNRTGSSGAIEGVNFHPHHPYPPAGAARCVYPHCMNDQWSAGKLPYRECLGGGYILQPCVLVQNQPTVAVLGELEGTYAISGYNNAAENTTVFNGKTHVVFQNAHRSDVYEYWALALD